MDKAAEQNVYLYQRNRLEITGVIDVCEFTPNAVELTLEDGYLGVDGDCLKIDYFSADSKKVLICGTVNGIVYYNKAILKKRKKKN